MNLSRSNLWVRLFVMVGLATVPAFMVLVYLQHELRDQGRAQIADEALRQAELLNADIRNVVEGARQLTLAISHFDTVRSADPGCARRLSDLRADLPSYALLSVIAEDGQVICTTAQDAPAFASAATAAHVHEIVRRGVFDVGTYMSGTATRGPVLPLCMPFTLSDGRHGVVIAGLSLDWLSEHLGELKRPSEGTMGIADRNGITLARYPEHEKFVGRPFPPPIRPFINAETRGHAVVNGYDGKERLIGYVPATELPMGLFVSVGMYLPDMMAALDRATLRGIGLMAMGAIVALLLALLAGERFLRRPAAALLAAAKRWSAGDLTARANLPDSPKSEFGTLATAFNGMALALAHQQQELRDLNTTLELRVADRTRDLSESRNRLQVEMAEREKTEASLRQAQKLQAVGQLAGGIAHDFNNLLTAVVGALDLTRARLAPGQESIARLVDNALHAAERGAMLTGQLLAFSRRQRLMAVPSDLNLIVVGLSNLLGSTLGRSIRIQTDLVQDLWPAMVDPGQIEAAMLNLAINARDAMPDGGVLTLATRNVPIEVSGALPAGNYVAIRVTDSGTGMDAAVLARAFEPFYSTKAPGRGSGLGLSQVHGLAMQSGGDVRIDSNPGEGTTVTLLLPRAKTMPMPVHRDMVHAQSRPRRRARVLVVDDDRDVREMTGEMLTESGYTVELAVDGVEALSLLERDSGFDMMLADFVMPGMNGAALIKAARRLRPGLRTLLMTGHAELDDDAEIDGDSIIRKPFNVATLDERMAAVLARPTLRSVQGGLPAAG